MSTKPAWFDIIDLVQDIDYCFGDGFDDGYALIGYMLLQRGLRYFPNSLPLRRIENVINGSRGNDYFDWSAFNFQGFLEKHRIKLQDFKDALELIPNLTNDETFYVPMTNTLHLNTGGLKKARINRVMKGFIKYRGFALTVEEIIRQNEFGFGTSEYSAKEGIKQVRKYLSACNKRRSSLTHHQADIQIQAKAGHRYILVAGERTTFDVCIDDTLYEEPPAIPKGWKAEGVSRKKRSRTIQD